MKKRKSDTINKHLLDILKESYGKDELYTKVCDEVILKVQKKFIEDFPIYVAKSEGLDKHNRKTGHYYMVAWVRFPHSITNQHRVFKTSVGRYKDFNGTLDIRCKEIARPRLLKRIQKEYSHLF
jgi:hypothetical protein